MEASTRNMLINTALRVAVDATGLIPGLGQVTAALRIANDVAPAVEEAVAYFESPEGQRAVAHMQALFGALSAAAENKMVFAQPAAPAAAVGQYQWVWVGGLEGYRWMTREDARKQGF